MHKEDVDTFEKLAGQVLSFYEEISLLSKKNPNDAINKFKLNLINKVILACNAFLEAKYTPFSDFIAFSEDDVPQNSDVVFILSQYLQCFEKYRADNVSWYQGSWQWKVIPGKGEKANASGIIYIRTVKPKNLKD